MGEIIEKSNGSENKPVFTTKEYNAVARKAELRAINLLSTNFDVSSDLLSQKDRWKLGYSVTENSCKYDEDRNFVAAIFKYVLTAKVGRRNAVRCAADFGVFYHVGEVENSDAAEAFCHNVGMYAAYPYFRSLVASLAWNAGIDLPPLPSIATTAHIPSEDSTEA